MILQDGQPFIERKTEKKLGLSGNEDRSEQKQLTNWEHQDDNSKEMGLRQRQTSRK